MQAMVNCSIPWQTRREGRFLNAQALTKRPFRLLFRHSTDLNRRVLASFVANNRQNRRDTVEILSVYRF